jgi:hypothetical protein
MHEQGVTLFRAFHKEWTRQGISTCGASFAVIIMPGGIQGLGGNDLARLNPQEHGMGGGKRSVVLLGNNLVVFGSEQRRKHQHDQQAQTSETRCSADVFAAGFRRSCRIHSKLMSR